MPERVVFTPAALSEPWGRQIAERVSRLGLPIEELPANRLTGLRGEDERATYRTSKPLLDLKRQPFENGGSGEGSLSAVWYPGRQAAPEC